MGKTKIKGLEKVINNLNKEIKKIEGRTLKGLIRGGIFVLRDVELKSPLTPVDLGNLRASRFLVSLTGGVSFGRGAAFKAGTNRQGRTVDNTVKLSADHSAALTDAVTIAKETSKVVKGPVVVLGFSANYAAAIHEKENVKKWSRPGSNRKFFEKAIDRNEKNILGMIGKEAKIK